MEVFLSPPPDRTCPDVKDWRGRPTVMAQACPKCIKWVRIQGKHPQGEQILDGWQCANVAKLLAQFETTQMVRQMEAGVTKKIIEKTDQLIKAVHHGTRTQIAIAESQMQIQAPAPLQLKDQTQ